MNKYLRKNFCSTLENRENVKVYRSANLSPSTTLRYNYKFPWSNNFCELFLDFEICNQMKILMC